jgi:hypothetical protein
MGINYIHTNLFFLIKIFFVTEFCFLFSLLSDSEQQRAPKMDKEKTIYFLFDNKLVVRELYKFENVEYITAVYQWIGEEFVNTTEKMGISHILHGQCIYYNWNDVIQKLPISLDLDPNLLDIYKLISLNEDSFLYPKRIKELFPPTIIEEIKSKWYPLTEEKKKLILTDHAASCVAYFITNDSFIQDFIKRDHIKLLNDIKNGMEFEPYCFRCNDCVFEELYYHANLHAKSGCWNIDCGFSDCYCFKKCTCYDIGNLRDFDDEGSSTN